MFLYTLFGTKVFSIITEAVKMAKLALYNLLDRVHVVRPQSTFDLYVDGTRQFAEGSGPY